MCYHALVLQMVISVHGDIDVSFVIWDLMCE